MRTPKKHLMSVLTLVMINIIAIDSIRSIPMSAHYGLSLIFYYILAGVTFFIPSALVSAELATAWPETGGIYIWVREAFGKSAAFLVIWIQWIYNICWYPTILSLLAVTLAYILNPSLANNPWYVLSIILVSYWSITGINLLGMRASGVLSTITAILGTLLPMAFISGLGILWLIAGKHVQISCSLGAFLPNLTKPNNLALLTGVVYSLVGIEMSAIHAQEVKNPQRDYPKALFYSSITILLSLVIASLAVAIVVPAAKLDLVTGLLDAFLLFFQAFHLTWLMPVVATLIIFGIIGGVGAWVLGPARGMLVAAKDGSIPPFLQKTNAENMPTALLTVQGLICSLICFVFIVMPTVNSAFWILSNLTAQLALSTYVFMFSAAIKLRYKHPTVTRAYKIPLRNVGIWLIATVGILSALATIAIGYFPPEQIEVGNLKFYEIFLVSGFLIFYATPLAIYKFRRRSWIRDNAKHSR